MEKKEFNIMDYLNIVWKYFFVRDYGIIFIHSFSFYSRKIVVLCTCFREVVE